jgi:phosphoribosylglycinamide formyltransferase 1
MKAANGKWALLKSDSAPVNWQLPPSAYSLLMSKPKIGILISGRGSNMVALLEAIRDGRLNAECVVVISNVESAAGLEKAKAFGIETLFISHKGRTREAHDREIVAELRKREVSLVCLAGYMRLISPHFVREFPNHILNIHPSLLPAFPGLDAQKQALDFGVKISGCTVHIVDEELDHGAIILQRTVAVFDDDTVETLAKRILEQEHQLYAEAVTRVLSEGFQIEGRRTYLKTGKMGG